MTAGKAIETADALRPNNSFDRELKILWLRQSDAALRRAVVSRSDTTDFDDVGADVLYDPEQELLRQDACERGIPLRLFGLLPEELRESYRPLLHESDPGVARIVKAADKLSAYIKCVEELKAGNREFEAAARQTRKALTEMHLPCLDYFMAHFLDAFQLTLDELD